MFTLLLASTLHLYPAQHTTAVFASTGEPPIASVASFGPPSGVHATLEHLMKCNVLRAQHRQLYNDFWRENNFDCIVMPPSPHVAPKLDQWKVINYLVPWNYLDYPACIIPVGRVDAGDVPGKAKYGIEDEVLYSTCKLSSPRSGRLRELTNEGRHECGGICECANFHSDCWKTTV